MDEEIVKVCKKHGELTAKQIYSTKKGMVCKQCNRNNVKKYVAKHPEKVREARKRWNENNPNYIRDRLKLRESRRRYRKEGRYKEKEDLWRKNNIEKLKNCKIKYRKEASEKISDSYVRAILCRSNGKYVLNASYIPKELIEAKRAQIKIIRELRKLKKVK